MQQNVILFHMKYVLKCFFVTILLLIFAYSIIWHVRGTHKTYPDLPSAEIVVGQNIIAGVQGPVLDRFNIAYLEKVRPGAVILYKFNIQSEEQLAVFIKQLQEIALRTTGRPYLIMIDEEPGGATRLGIYRDAFTGTTPNWDAIRRDTQKLKDLGINVVLSPLADLPIDATGSVSHRMPIRTHDELVDFNNRYIALLKELGIGTTLKHFPGIGLIEEDTHKKVIKTDASTSTVMQAISLFADGVQSGADFVMTGQAIYTAIDPTYSATVSRTLLSILRNDLKFKGIIITDDMANMPVGNPDLMEPYEATVEALRAGQTMVMLGSRRSLIENVYTGLLNAYITDLSMKEIFDRNYIQITEYKDQTLGRHPGMNIGGEEF